LPRDLGAAASWRDARRARLREIVMAKRFEIEAEKVAAEEKDGLNAGLWKLKFGPWSVPVVELSRGEPRGSVLLVADGGRKEAADAARERLDRGERVFAVDPFYVGEAKVAEKDYLFALLLAAVGDRPLGLQAGELAAVARWARTGRGAGPLSILAVGPRTSTMALVAAALEDEAIGGLELRDALGSLKEPIESRATYSGAPELFCFGLLEEFDIAQLAALAAPRPIVFTRPTVRASKELTGLKDWYATWGVALDPLAAPARGSGAGTE
jgi:hypothetical protein